MDIKSRFIPVSDWADYHPWPTPGAFRVHICNAEKRARTGHGNGDPTLLECVVRVGTRVLIDEELFVDWVRQHKAVNSDSLESAA